METFVVIRERPKAINYFGRIRKTFSYVEACNEFAEPISASLRPGNLAHFEEMAQRRRDDGNTVTNLTSPRVEPKTYLFRDESVNVMIKKFNFATWFPIPEVREISDFSFFFFFMNNLWLGLSRFFSLLTQFLFSKMTEVIRKKGETRSNPALHYIVL